MSNPITGSVIGGGAFKVTGFLRQGAMGDVYVGRRVEDDQRVSIKLLDPGALGDAEVVQRFRQELEVSRTIDHVNTLRVLASGDLDTGQPFLVTEYLEGDTLEEMLEEQKTLPVPRVAHLAAQIAAGLGAAHQHGIIHRDLRSSNIMVCAIDGIPDVVKILDFGLARKEDGKLTQVGVHIGDPRYMAPEYIDEYRIDARSDLYSLGILMWEMLVGEPPFTGKPFEILEKHVETPAPRPSSRNGDVPEWMDAIVMKLLAKDPDQRPADADEVLEALEITI
ncbi:MAG: serine/threonine protein kinase [Alphaproteobacteria bacterium]|nr:serine/threonine protein kinase [Alphaproteobacteria bacterium]